MISIIVWLAVTDVVAVSLLVLLATDGRAVLELSALFLFLDNHDLANIISRYFAKIVFHGDLWHERWSTVTARRYSIVLVARF